MEIGLRSDIVFVGGQDVPGAVKHIHSARLL